jgi:hypothetical protein
MLASRIICTPLANFLTYSTDSSHVSLSLRIEIL